MEYNISNMIITHTAVFERINYVRRELNLNQEQLALKLGISQPAVSKYLKDRLPPAEVLLRLAHLGQTTVEWILTGKKGYFFQAEGNKVEDVKTGYMDADMQLAAKISRLNAKAKQAITILVDALQD